MRRGALAIGVLTLAAAFAPSALAQSTATYTLDGEAGALAQAPGRARWREMPGHPGCPRYVIRGAYFQLESTEGPIRSVRLWLLVPDHPWGGDYVYRLTPRCPGAALRVSMETGAARVRSGRITMRATSSFRTMTGRLTGRLSAVLIAPDGTERAFEARFSLSLAAAGR